MKGQSYLGVHVTNRNHTDGGRKEMKILSLWSVEMANLTRLCAGQLARIMILSNYLSEFERIRVSDCERDWSLMGPPNRINGWTVKFLFGRVSLISFLSQLLV